MTLLWVALIGSAAAAGLLLLVQALRPKPVPLSDITARLNQPRFRATAETGDQLEGWQRTLARWGQKLMGATGLTLTDELAENLRVLDKTHAQHAYEKMLGAVAGFALPVLLWIVLAAGDVVMPVLGVLLLSSLLAAGGFFYPDLPMADKVAERRQEFRHQLSAYLDLVTIIIAGGGGIDSALRDAAAAGDGWGFAKLRHALNRSRTTKRTSWETLSELGSELGVDELIELAASVSLAGDYGAKVKESLIAKADSLRGTLATEMETAAEKKTEQMILPVTVMILGLILLVGYGAADAISSPSDEIVDTNTPIADVTNSGGLPTTSTTTSTSLPPEGS